MSTHTEQKALNEAQQAKLKELQEQQAKLKELKTELERINAKINNNEKLSAEDTKYIGNLGWLTALSVSIAALASSLT
jgi:uncharacterized protein YlxW (UPF0749 family)